MIDRSIEVTDDSMPSSIYIYHKVVQVVTLQDLGLLRLPADYRQLLARASRLYRQDQAVNYHEEWVQLLIEKTSRASMPEIPNLEQLVDKGLSLSEASRWLEFLQMEQYKSLSPSLNIGLMKRIESYGKGRQIHVAMVLHEAPQHTDDFSDQYKQALLIVHHCHPRHILTVGDKSMSLNPGHLYRFNQFMPHGLFLDIEQPSRRKKIAPCSLVSVSFMKK